MNIIKRPYKNIDQALRKEHLSYCFGILVIWIFVAFAWNVHSASAAARSNPFSAGETVDPGADAEPCGPLDANCFPTSALTSSTASFFTATSTTATSTFAGPVQITDLVERGPTFDVRAFGAVGDGVTDDSGAIQAAVNAVSTSRGGVVYFPPNRSYYVGSTISLPVTTTNMAALTFHGYGATLTTDQAISIFQRLPSSQSQANTYASSRVNIFGLTFIGDNTTGQKAVEIGATFGSVFKDLYISSFDTGFDCQFCLMGSLSNSLFINNNVDSVTVRTGVGQWSGAALSTSASNHFIVDTVRVYNKANASTSISILGSNGVVINNSITEGNDPTYNIYYDAQNSTTVKLFSINNLHSENSPSDSIIRVIANGGQVVINGVKLDTAETVINDSGSNTSSYVVVKNIPYFPSGAAFRTDGSGKVWQFSDMGNGTDFTQSTYWRDGTKPGTVSVVGNLYNGVNRFGIIAPVINLYGTASTSDVALNGSLKDSTGSVGSSGQVLTSTGSATQWETVAVANPWTTSGSDIYYHTGSDGIGSASIGTSTTNKGTLFIQGDGNSGGTAFGVANANGATTFSITDAGNITGGSATLSNTTVNTLTSASALQLGFSSYIRFGASGGSGRSVITSPPGSTGNLLLQNNAQNNFNQLMLGGTDASFPSIKRNATGIDIRLADDSNYAPLAAQTGYFASGVGIASTTPWKTLSVDGTVAFNGLTNDNSGNYVCLSGNNEITHSATACAGASSERFKNTIEGLNFSGLELVGKLRPVSFYYNEDISPNDRTQHLGFIAEEVSEVWPALVVYDAEDRAKSVKYDEFVPILAKAIQEQQIEIDALSGTTASNTSFMMRVVDHVKDAFANAVSRFKSIFVRELHVEEKLCADDICVTKDQLKALLLDAGGTRGTAADNGDDSDPESSSQESSNDENQISTTPDIEDAAEATTTQETAGEISNSDKEETIDFSSTEEQVAEAEANRDSGEVEESPEPADSDNGLAKDDEVDSGGSAEPEPLEETAVEPEPAHDEAASEEPSS